MHKLKIIKRKDAHLWCGGKRMPKMEMFVPDKKSTVT